MKKKINYYLVATALFVAIATMVSMTVINYYLFQKQVKEDLQVMAETIESTGILKQDINEIPQIDVEGIRVTWIDKDGTVLYDNQNDVKKLENHGDRPEVESAFDKGTGDSVRTSATMNSNTFYHAIKLNDGTVLRVSIAARSIWNMFASSIPAMLIVTVIIVGICVVLAKSLTRKLMKPIETLAGNLEQASVIEKKTEYKELVENLCQNAIRYNNEGGTVNVTVHKLGGKTVLTVEDNGIGIPKDQQERVFERFYRVDKSRSKETGGTGLGLAIVKHIVELHDAGLTLDSEVGRGTTIKVEF